MNFAYPPPQAIINSTVTPNMTFTKTSQKFGQWADSRANTVYGLGFASEQHLTQVGLWGYMVGGTGLGMGLLLGAGGPWTDGWASIFPAAEWAYRIGQAERKQN